VDDHLALADGNSHWPCFWLGVGPDINPDATPLVTFFSFDLYRFFSIFPATGLVNSDLLRSTVAAVAIGFMLNNSSYFSEVFRAGIQSVPSGQMEAARSTGLTRLQALRYVIVPQATRNVLPDLVGNGIEVIKLTTIASVVALPELLRVARDAQSLVYNPSPIVLAALMYLALLLPLVRLLSRLEHRGRVH
jgi:ABC-type amino acid transport system permease subunit